MIFYRRRLPHWQPESASIFLTWRPHGSLPKGIEPSALSAGKRFVLLDWQVDLARTGPTWLKRPDVAPAVVDTLLLAAEGWKLYELFACVVMVNHVHVLLAPHKSLRALTRTVKNTSARAANRILERTGQPFWQEEATTTGSATHRSSTALCVTSSGIL